MVMRADVWIDACEAVWNDLPPEVTRGRTVRTEPPGPSPRTSPVGDVPARSC
jgi:hypothetical protein